MHYQEYEMKYKLKADDVQSFMRSEFDGFDDIVDMENGLYDALGDFAIYLRDKMNEETLSEEMSQKAFNIMNVMGASEDLEVQNLLVVGILEVMTDEHKVVSLVKKGLSGPAAELFERVIVGWNKE